MKLKILFLMILIGFSACTTTVQNPTQQPATLLQPSPSHTITKTPVDTPTQTATATYTSTPTLTPSPTLTVTISNTPTQIPTYQVLRGEVNAAHVNCYYGPGKAYLYKYGLVGGSNLEIIGQNMDTGYLLVQAIGGNNPCWMNSEWMDVRGNLSDVKPIPPTEVNLPQSPYYGPPSGQNAIRNGDEVTITWNWFGLRAGDDSQQYPYLVEAWVCLEGKLVFTPIGSWVNTITITDQAGCVEKSHALLYAVEKHGYPPAVEIPWPDHSENN